MFLDKLCDLARGPHSTRRFLITETPVDPQPLEMLRRERGRVGVRLGVVGRRAQPKPALFDETNVKTLFAFDEVSIRLRRT